MEHALTAMEQEDVPCVQAEENGKITTEYIMIAVYVMAEDNAQVVMAVENYANIFVPNPAVIINEFYKIIKDGKLKKGYLLNIPFFNFYSNEFILLHVPAILP